MFNYFSPSSNNFPYNGAPGRGQSGSGGAASSLSSMFSTNSGKDLRGSSSYENDFVIYSLQGGGAAGGPGGALLKSSSASSAAVTAAGAGSQPSAAGSAASTVVNGGGVSNKASTAAAQLGFHDASEFPTLSGRGGGATTAASLARQQGAAAAAVAAVAAAAATTATQRGQSGYANLIRQPEPRTEFQIHNEDFPALPGSQEAKQSSALLGSTDSLKDSRFPGNRTVLPKRGIQTHPDGTVTGIPAGMLNDQFGMVGLVACLQAIETDPSIIPLALGHDLTTLGLNLNAPEKNLYQNFGGPWADTPCRPQDIDYHVPSEYLTNAAIVDKLAAVKLNRYTEDLLFYLFYNFGGEMFQLAAAAELFNRDWRYHKEEKCWLTRASLQGVKESTQTHERGTYYVFDAAHWRKVPKEMTLEYNKLEDRPVLPPQQPIVAPQQQQQQPHNA